MQFLELRQELLFGLFTRGIRYRCANRTNLSTFGTGEEADAFGTFVRINDINCVAFFDSLIRTFRFAGTTTDALFGNLKRHRKIPSSVYTSLFYPIYSYFPNFLRRATP